MCERTLSGTVRTFPIKARKQRVTYRIDVRSIRYSTNICLALRDSARRVRWPSLVHRSQRRIPIHCHLVKEILGVLRETLVNSSINFVGIQQEREIKRACEFPRKKYRAVLYWLVILEYFFKGLKKRFKGLLIVESALSLSS